MVGIGAATGGRLVGGGGWWGDELGLGRAFGKKEDRLRRAFRKEERGKKDTGCGSLVRLCLRKKKKEKTKAKRHSFV